MIHRRLTTAEAAARLGVKPATLYSYVSRGVLARLRTAAGSTFDPQEVARLARSARPRSGVGPPAGAAGDRGGADTGAASGAASGAAPGPGAGDRPNDGNGPNAGGEDRRRGPRRNDARDPIFVTELTLIDGGRLFYRGLEAVDLSRSRTFEAVAEWLWTGRWPTGEVSWAAPPAAATAAKSVLRSVRSVSLPVEKFMVAVAAAALTDQLRHDLSPAAVPIVGRGLLATLVESLPTVASVRSSRRRDPSISGRLWPRLSRLEITPGRKAVLEAALVLSADHELAPSTLAARVAAAFRADPYAVVSTGLGPASGSWRSGSSGAPSEVEALLSESEGGDPEAAIGARLHRTGAVVHGFGMPLYPAGDPRGAELLSRLAEVEGRKSSHELVDRVLSIGESRGFPPPNVDMGLGALAFCAEMIPGAGQAIATLGKVAGWLAHAMEEYAEPTEFRTRAAYIGSAPAAVV
jgi:citrate synthase